MFTFLYKCSPAKAPGGWVSLSQWFCDRCVRTGGWSFHVYAQRRSSVNSFAKTDDLVTFSGRCLNKSWFRGTRHRFPKSKKRKQIISFPIIAQLTHVCAAGCKCSTMYMVPPICPAGSALLVQYNLPNLRDSMWFLLTAHREGNLMWELYIFIGTQLS